MSIPLSPTLSPAGGEGEQNGGMVPDALLDGIAARPDDAGVWEVLTDWLLEQDAPGATLARCDLELFRGISNPDLLGALSDARAQRPKLPFEPYGGYDALWRCGYVVRLQLTSQLPAHQFAPLLAAPALRGLHHLRYEDLSAREGGRAFFEGLGGPPVSQQMAQLCVAVTPQLRRFTLQLEERVMPLLPSDLSQVFDALAAGLPKKVERVDLSLPELSERSLDSLGALAQRLKQLNLDGTKMTALGPGALARMMDAAPGCTFFFAGTWRSPRDLEHPRAQWLAPEVVAWLEHEETGVLVPLTPASAHDGFFAPSWPNVARSLKRELLGWSRRDAPLPNGEPSLLEDGALLLLEGAGWRFRIR